MKDIRQNLVWSFLVIGIGLMMLLRAIDILPEALNDLIQRAWPIILVIVGLNMLLTDRLRLGNWLSVGLSGILLGVIVVFAYDTQAEVVREDYMETIDPIFLGDHIQEVHVRVNTLDTTWRVQPTPDQARVIGATFVGSSESRVVMNAQENEPGILEFTITETRPQQFPHLAKIGRGHVDMWIPVGVTIASFELSNQTGGMYLDFEAADVPRVNIQSTVGDIDIRMPREGIVIGDLALGDGDLRLFMDENIDVRIANAPANATFNQNRYILALQDQQQQTLETRSATQFIFNLNLVELNGSLAVLPLTEE